MMRQPAGYINLIAFLLFLSCKPQQRDEKVITVTIEPIRYFTEKITGGKFAVNTVVPEGQSPEAYDPTPQQMVQIGKSAAYLQTGYIGFELAWMDKIKENNPDVKFFDLSEKVNLLTSHHGHAHEHGGHRHEGADPHIWSSTEGAKTIAWNILNAILSLDRDNASFYWENFNGLMEEIDSTEVEIMKYVAPLLSRAFIIYHPALTYYAHDFNLTQLCIETDGKEPTPAQLKELIDTAHNYNVRVIFIQEEFDKKSAEVIAHEAGCKLVTINPLSYDWGREMIHIAKALDEEDE